MPDRAHCQDHDFDRLTIYYTTAYRLGVSYQGGTSVGRMCGSTMRPSDDEWIVDLAIRTLIQDTATGERAWLC